MTPQVDIMRFKCGFYTKPKDIADIIVAVLTINPFVKPLTVKHLHDKIKNCSNIWFVIETNIRVLDRFDTLIELIKINREIQKAITSYQALVPGIDSYCFFSSKPSFRLIK